MRSLIIGLVGMTALLSGCGAGALVAPGHRALYFDPDKGLKHEPLNEGYHHLYSFCINEARCPHVDDFDVTYSTRKEDIRTTSQEGLQMDLRLALIYRPVISELYELDTQIGMNYYDEVVGPEFRSAARGVLARHSYMELVGKDQKIEDEIEDEVRKRIKGKHIEISSIVMESVNYAPEIAAANRSRIVAEQEATRKKAAIENEHLLKQTEVQHKREEDQTQLEAETEHARQEAQAKGEQAKFLAQTAMEQAQLAATAEKATKTHELEMAKLDTTLARARREAKIADARGEAEAATLLAHAHSAENQAQAQLVTPLTVQMHAYDALGKLGGEGTTILLGEWSHVPNFLFPRAGAFANAYNPYAPQTAPGSGSSSPLSMATPHAANPNVPARTTDTEPKGTGL
jgi:regulator of protease activity HflC (stomatin/prohibitin superfamily)